MSLIHLTEEQFEKLSLLEKSEYISKMQADGHTQTDLAQMLGVSRKQIWRYQKLAEQPYEIRLKISTGDMPLKALEMQSSNGEIVVSEPVLPSVTTTPLPDKQLFMMSQLDASDNTPSLPSIFGDPFERPEPTTGEFDDVYEKYRKWIDWRGAVVTREASLKQPNSRTVVTVINDLHCPHQDNDLIAKLVAETADETDILVIAGDFMDMFNWSKWSKASKNILPVDEIRVGQSVLNMLAENYPEIRMLYGNHDARLIRHLQGKGVDGEFLDVFRWMTNTYGNKFSILHAMCHGLPNVSVIENTRLDEAEYYFFHQIGDLIIGHPELYSKIPNRSVANFIHWLKSFAEPAGLLQPFKVVSMGHTHQAGMTWNDFGVVGLEMGCLEKYPDYVSDPKCRTPRPWVQGYTKFVLEDDKVVLNESRFYTLR